MGHEGYVLGYGERETRRLERQAAFIGDQTEAFLAQVLRPGMRVLDAGCGAGDVTMACARLVGASGSVVGADRDGASLARASARASGAGLGNVTFAPGEAPFDDVGDGFDAVVGRFFLMYSPDPAATLRGLGHRLAPGGAMAFHEVVLSTAGSFPAVAAVETSLSRLRAVYARLGLHADMGAILPKAFLAAGMRPETTLSSRLEADGLGFCPAWLAGIVASAVPMMEATGVATAAAVDVPTLEARIRSEVEAAGATMLAPLMVGAVGRIAS